MQENVHYDYYVKYTVSLMNGEFQTKTAYFHHEDYGNNAKARAIHFRNLYGGRVYEFRLLTESEYK